MFGSRLRILTNNGEMLGACPARMDAPSSYISPESFDLLTLTKGPQTVLWGPGNSAGTIRFDREQPRFDKPGVQGNASLLAASNNRWDENADISLGSEDGYLRLMGNKSRSDDYKDGNGDRVPSKWDKWNGDMALGWTPDKDTLIELTAGKGTGNRVMRVAVWTAPSSGEKAWVPGSKNQISGRYSRNLKRMSITTTPTTLWITIHFVHPTVVCQEVCRKE
jgi:TonB-dependent copper receptor